MTVGAGITTGQFRTAVAAAVRAPSMYNAQPWRFALCDGTIRVRIDPERVLPVADPDNWGARVACGAAVAGIQVALAAAGIATDAELTVGVGDRLLVGTVAATGPYTPTPDDRGLSAAIPRRRSNRHPFFDTAVPAEARARMTEAAMRAGAQLRLIDDRPTVARVAEIVREAHQRLQRDAAYVAELRAWVDRDDADRTGVGPDEAGPAPAGQDLLALRDFGGPPRAPGRDFETDPLIGVLSHTGFGGYNDARAGIALQMVLLTATDQRLATSMHSQPIEVPELREELRGVVGGPGRPHMVIRIGFGQPGRPPARRSLDSVIDRAG